MSNDRLSALEVSLREQRAAFEVRSERREQQLAAIATDVAGIDQRVESNNFRLGALEAVKPLTIVQIITVVGVLSTIGATLVGAFVSMQTQVFDARMEAFDARLSTQLVELTRLGDRQFKIATDVAYERGRLDGVKRQVEDIDEEGSRH